MPSLDNLPVVVPLLSFVLVALASKQIGRAFSSIGLPYITGYLLAGTLAGPFILGMMPSGSIDSLRFIDELSLAIIAFVAGSELFLKELRSQLRTILLNAGGIVVAALLLIGLALFGLAGVLAFAEGFTTAERIAMALLGATVLLALSPASTIAVMQEVRAKGTFSKTILSITVVMDVVIIVLFAIAAAFAGTLIEGRTLSALFVGMLALDLVLAVLVGVFIGGILTGILRTTFNQVVKTALILAVGLGLFTAAHYIDGLGLGIHLEPLLSAMIAGFFVTNFTENRREFEDVLHDVSPMVYVAFFTLTGVGLKLDVLLSLAGAVALVLFFVRMFAIFVGSFLGGTLAGESRQYRRLAWAGLITQAGIALGLSREISVAFPDTLGSDFATMIIAVVVLNEIFGPMLLKFALRQSGDSHEPGKPTPDAERNVVIIGIESQSLTLARQLEAQNWQVILADVDRTRVELVDNGTLRAKYITGVSQDCLDEIITGSTDAVVAMLADDHANLTALEAAYEQHGIKRLVVRLNDLSLADRFVEIGAKVVDPTTATLSVIDQYVRAPQSAALMLHQDPQYDIAQVTITELDVSGVLLRDLRLPTDVLILEVSRRGQSIVPHGQTKIMRGDEVILVGKPDSLKQATLRLGF
jgi:Trk K+ transport system NAD-binding subunit/Kef-type K+ transport system membrane component KefB